MQTCQGPSPQGAYSPVVEQAFKWVKKVSAFWFTSAVHDGALSTH